MKRIIKLILLFFAYQLAVTAVFTGVFMLWNHTTELPNPSNDNYVTFLLAVQLAFTIFLSVHLWVGRYVKIGLQPGKSSHTTGIWLLSLALIIGLGLWNNYLNELIDLPNTNEAFLEDMMRHPMGIVATVIMAPIMEELLFRGAMQGYLLRKWKNPIWAILMSSFVFGAIHGNPAQIPFAFCVGLGLGWVYYKTGSLLPGMFMHFVNNGSAVLLFWLTDNSESTLIGTLGIKMATVLALGGIVLTVLAVWGIQKCTKDRQISWYGIPD